MMTSYFNLLKYAATGQASPSMTYYDRMRASTLMGGVVQTLTGITPLSFKADGSPLISWSMKGNGSQQGTPTPYNPITPDFVGTLDGADWTIPITCGGETTSVYLGQTQTVRKIRKLVLTGTETWERQAGLTVDYFRIANMPAIPSKVICTHYQSPDENIAYSTVAVGIKMQQSTSYGVILACRPSLDIPSLADFKAYLSQQYAAGTPVVIWYVLATEQTGIVNEPLCKIGDYADELNSTDAGASIPTVKGSNTLTVESELQPSEMTITYRG